MAHSEGHSDRGVCAVNEALSEGAHDCEGFLGVLYVIHIALCCLKVREEEREERRDERRGERRKIKWVERRDG